jgi:hypothetical protein
MAVRIIRGLYVNTNANSSIEVGYSIDGATGFKLYTSQAQLIEAADFFTTNERAVDMAIASWLGIDADASNPSLFTDWTVEVDWSSLIAVRRVLNL